MLEKSVLIVDDEEGLRRSIVEIFKVEGYKVFAAEDGDEGIKLLKNESVDLMISDIFMPNKDGMELAREARSIKPNLKIILVSGGSQRSLSDGTSLDYLKPAQTLSQADRILRKPFAIQELLDMAQEVLSN